MSGTSSSSTSSTSRPQPAAALVGSLEGLLAEPHARLLAKGVAPVDQVDHPQAAHVAHLAGHLRQEGREPVEREARVDAGAHHRHVVRLAERVERVGGRLVVQPGPGQLLAGGDHRAAGAHRLLEQRERLLEGGGGGQDGDAALGGLQRGGRISGHGEPAGGNAEELVELAAGDPLARVHRAGEHELGSREDAARDGPADLAEPKDHHRDATVSHAPSGAAFENADSSGISEGSRTFIGHGEKTYQDFKTIGPCGTLRGPRKASGLRRGGRAASRYLICCVFMCFGPDGKHRFTPRSVGAGLLSP
jgi:hypothetical protein